LSSSGWKKREKKGKGRGTKNDSAVSGTLPGHGGRKRKKGKGGERDGKTRQGKIPCRRGAPVQHWRGDGRLNPCVGQGRMRYHPRRRPGKRRGEVKKKERKRVFPLAQRPARSHLCPFRLKSGRRGKGRGEENKKKPSTPLPLPSKKEENPFASNLPLSILSRKRRGGRNRLCRHFSAIGGRGGKEEKYRTQF